ncbi:MAG TPA: asparagine synthase (glutamine-hydrolyzing) [Gemmatimonadales bacterium]|nr:asparagine synthase (glutamine-hydrolyzing) [Gemmatimonadales bacterium]
MCGIAGIVPLADAAPATIEQLHAMCDTLVHRGPDAEGAEVRRGVGLGMRRLSVIDLAGGFQPLYNEDRRVRLVFNGEIYNFRALRAELEGRGHHFATGSDGEVIVHLWEELGPAAFARLNGMFALALHDERTQTVVLARDHVGIKPLYYAHRRGYVVFGSELKAVLASRLVERALDVEALAEFLAWEYVPAPRTLLTEVRKLPPATLLLVDLAAGTVEERRWWEVPVEPYDPAGAGLPRGEAEWEEAIDAAVRAAVERQLVSDVPLGAFLSGGVDSSLVAAAMAATGETKTYSIGFDDPSYNELAWSGRVARHLGVAHRTEVIRPDVVELFPRLMHHLDDPIGDFSIFPTFLVSGLARREVTVALSGDGADEIFGGYETYVAQERARLWRRVPAAVRRGVAEPVIDALRPRPEKKGLVNKAKRFVEGARHPDALGHARWRLFLSEALRRSLFAPGAAPALATPLARHVLELFEEAGPRGAVDRALYVDVKSYLSDNCLVKTDRMSMACSLEARVPLLDPELVALAFRMPEALKVQGGRTKVLLKRVAARHVPAECVYRPKEGFSIPIKHWLGREFRPLVDTLLDRRRLDAEGLFRGDTVECLKQEHFAGRANHSHLLWSLLVVQDWRERWAA